MTGPATSVYVTMSDGVRIAVSVWHADPPVPRPVVLQFTEYWRYPADSPVVAARIDEVAAAFDRCGYGYATVDIRGSGASFGTRDGIFTPRVREDIAEVVRWAAAQPFCDGEVFAYGISNAGTFAEWAALSGEAAVRGVAMLYSDFDLFGDTFLPGGVETNALTSIWQPVMAVRDGVLAADDPAVPEALREKASLFAAGVLPVDDDPGRELLRAAIEEHRRNIDLRIAAGGLEFRDDPFGVARGGLDEASTFRWYADGGRCTVPQLVIASWRDAATARGALNRFLASDGPMRVELTPWGHGGDEPGDPYRGAAGDPIPVGERIARIAGFFDACRRSEPIPRRIAYYVLGGDEWRETAAWPPPGETREWHAAPDGRLAEHDTGPLEVLIDRDAGTGELTRWRTQVTGCAVDDRAFSAGDRPRFDSAPFDRDALLAGTPVAIVRVAPVADDGAVFAYLEAVTPDGEAHLLTDGQLRFRARAERTPGDGLDLLRSAHSLRRADALPVRAGEPIDLAVELLPVAARIPRGARLRLSFAASDTASFTRVPATGPTGFRLLAARLHAPIAVP